MAESKKCAHGVCDCMVDSDTKYCSEYCEDAEDAGVMEIGCGCRHPGCNR